jgi:hypothetical protein
MTKWDDDEGFSLVVLVLVYLASDGVEYSTYESV